MKIILTTANARYTHCAFGLRCLAAALKERGYETSIREFTIQQSAVEMAEALLGSGPDVIGFGVYIWNVDLITHVASIIRSVSPGTILVLGGPEMTENDGNATFLEAADFIISGEGEEALCGLIGRLAGGELPASGYISEPPPALDTRPSPYALYTEEDIRNRIIYVESSRGCPYRCAFCLSSRDEKVRNIPLPVFFADMTLLLERGVRLFKFTDRTFNIDDGRVVEILRFFLLRSMPEMQLHFEIMPDRLSDRILEMMSAFPQGMLHLELGVQSFSEETQQKIGRRQHMGRTMETIAFLRNHTGALLHADLIIGLPGDTEAVLARGFDALVKAGVQEIQVGLLKRLKGTPMVDEAGRGLTFDARPPYEVLETPEMPFPMIQRLKRFARYFDLYYNRGHFPESLPLLWQAGGSPFAVFNAFAAFLWQREGRAHGLSLARLSEQLFAFSCETAGCDKERTATCIDRDFRRLPGRRDKLDFIP
ncbi:MAG TPA: DUF4080 domain-containing protein [Candidatus Hydrogenedentes bacterium]|nr:DUF4080 domain-containing protein [Candidatus Hydrogenedentota bacterium]